MTHWSRSARAWAATFAVAIVTTGVSHTVAVGPLRSPSGERLLPGSEFQKRGARGEIHRYEVLLTAGDFFDVGVSQEQLQVGLSAQGPDGAVLRTIDVPAADTLPERLMIIAPVTGLYALDVSVVGAVVRIETARTSPTNTQQDRNLTYTLRVLAMRPATTRDRGLVDCVEVLEKAARLGHLQTMDGLRQSIPLFHEAAAGWRAAEDIGLEALTLEALARLTSYFTEFHKESAAARERLADLYARWGDPALEVFNLRRLGTEYYEDGRLEFSKDVARRALSMALQHQLWAEAARCERNLGVFEFELGNYDKARELALQAQEHAVAIASPELEAFTNYDLARLDDVAGDLDAAVTRSRRGLQMAQGRVSATTLLTMWLGFAHLRRGDLDEAQSLFEARVAMMRTTVQRGQEALARVGLGDVLLARGDRAGARQRYEAAASVLERDEQHLRCIAEQRLGRLDLEDGRLGEAQARFDTILGIAQARHSPQCESAARAGLADVAARRGDLDTAAVEAGRVVEIGEAFREAAISLESRSLGFGALAPAYERAIEIAMRRAEQGDADASWQALRLNEQALARGLLDRVLEGRLDARARVSPTLVAERDEIRARWRARLAELQVAVRTNPEAAATKALIAETSALALQIRDTDTRIDAADARHASFVRPRPLEVDAIQRLLDADTLLLEYALGEERSYLWVVSPREIRAFTLAPRAVIETLARRVHEHLAQSPAAAHAAEAGWSDVDDRRALARLLLEPAASLLTGKRLVVVLPGALSLVPFSALPTPGASDRDPLVRHHEIVQIPSATILASMRMLTAGRSTPTKLAAVFADPIFDRSDPRVRRAAGTAPAHARAASTLVLARLPFSRAEADAIGALAPGAVTTFVGAAATRERVIGGAVADYRFVHFATHAIVNQDVPGLTSLVLSLVDRTGHARDGTVMLPDVYDMTLRADVVVLSGCQTALGKDIRGEGPIGLARAFMYAGTPRVVASLWPVDDLATAELMKRFYRGMLVDKLTPAAALHAAQRELAATRRWRSPYFWAAFVLQGDWR
jgi:CHAT domain-containing protein